MHKSSIDVIHNIGDETLPWHNIPIQITILSAVVIVVVCLYYGKASLENFLRKMLSCTVHKGMSNFCYFSEAC